jgi:hypothetical protein
MKNPFAGEERVVIDRIRLEKFIQFGARSLIDPGLQRESATTEYQKENKCVRAAHE